MALHRLGSGRFGEPNRLGVSLRPSGHRLLAANVLDRVADLTANQRDQERFGENGGCVYCGNASLTVAVNTLH